MLPYQISPTTARPPRNSISGGSSATVLVTLRLVRYSRCAALANRRLSCASAPKRLDDAVAGERLGGDVRQVLELLLAPPRRAADALAEPDQRIDHERRAGHAHQREVASPNRTTEQA